MGMARKCAIHGVRPEWPFFIKTRRVRWSVCERNLSFRSDGAHVPRHDGPRRESSHANSAGLQIAKEMRRYRSRYAVNSLVARDGLNRQLPVLFGDLSQNGVERFWSSARNARCLKFKLDDGRAQRRGSVDSIHKRSLGYR